MNIDEAEDLAARVLAAIGPPEDYRYETQGVEAHANADRERVASDLAGLREHRDDGAGWCRCEIGPADDCPDATRYADNLRRTAALYGVS